MTQLQRGPDFRSFERTPEPVDPSADQYNSRQINALVKSPDGWEEILDEETFASLQEQTASSPDPTLDRKIIANQALMADRYGKDSAEIRDNYPEYRNHFGRTVLGLGDDSLDDSTFYQAAGQLVQKEEDEVDLLNETTAGIFRAQLSGSNFKDFYEGREPELKDHPGYSPEKRDLMRETSRIAWEKIENKKAELAGEIREVEGYFTALNEAGDLEQPSTFLEPSFGRELSEKDQAAITRKKQLKDRALNVLSRLSDSDRYLVMEIAAQNQAEAQEGEGESRSFGQKLGERVARGAGSFAEELGTLASRTIRGDVLRGPGEITQASKMDDVERGLIDRFTGQVDPIEAETWLTNGLLDAAESIPQMAVAFSIPGMVLMAGAAQTRVRRELNDLGIEGPKAELIALGAGGAIAAIERAESLMVFGGKIPGLTGATKWLGDFATKKTLKVGARTGITFGLQAVGQLGEEAAQELARPLFQDIGGVFDASIPDVKWWGKGGEFSKLPGLFPETAGALLPLVLLGTSTASFRNTAIGNQMLRDDRILTALGFSERQKIEIKDAQPEVAQATFQAHFAKREGIGSAEQRAAIDSMNAEGQAAASAVSGPQISPEAQAQFEQINLDADRIEVGERVDASKTFTEGSETVTLTDPQTKGKMEILIHGKPVQKGVVEFGEGQAPSVLSLFVPEESRGTGSGKALQAKALQMFPNLQGQVSSKAAAKNAFQQGRRPVLEAGASLERTFELIDEDSSVNMQIPQAVGVADRVQELADLTTIEEMTALREREGVSPTQVAYNIGLDVRNVKDAQNLLNLADEFRQRTAALQEEISAAGGDIDPAAFDQLSLLATQSQLFREAYEAATGSGSAVTQLLQDNPEQKFPILINEDGSLTANPEVVPQTAPVIEAPDLYSVEQNQEGEYVVTDPQGKRVGATHTPWMAARMIEEDGRIQAGLPLNQTEQAQRAQAGNDIANQWTPTQPNSARAAMVPREGTNLKHPSNAPQVIKAFERIIVSIGERGDGQVRVGRDKSLKRSALGFYRPHTRIIRLRTANDIEVAAHEIAHALDDAFFAVETKPGVKPEGSMVMKGNVSHWPSTVGSKEAKELDRLGHDLYGSKVPVGSYWNEGFSEFVRMYMTDTPQAQGKAPNFFEWFENELLPKNPDLRKSVKAAQALGNQFYSQGARARAAAGIAETPGLVESMRTALESHFVDARRNWLDSGEAIRQLTEAANEERAKRGRKDVLDRQDPFITMSARALTADAVVDKMANVAMLDFAGNAVGESLSHAFSIARQGGSIDDFVIFLWAKRAIRLWRDPIHGPRNPGMTLADANFLVGSLDNPHFTIAAQKYWDWNDSVLNYAAEASPEYAQVVENIRKGDPGHYLPLNREFSALDQLYAGKGGGGNLVQRLKGSGRRIKNPIESTLNHAKAIVLKSHQKRVVDQVFELFASTPGLGTFGGEVQLSDVKTRVPQWQLWDQLRKKVEKGTMEKFNRRMDQLNEDFEAGRITEEELFEKRNILTNELTSGPTVSERIDPIQEVLLGQGGFDFFLPQTNPKQNEWPLFPRTVPDGKGGTKTQWFEVRPDIFTAIAGMDGYRLPKGWDVFLGMPARMTRLGTTGLRASFSLVTNPLRDFRTLQVNSQASANSMQLFGMWLSSMRDSLMLAINRPDLASKWGQAIDNMGVKMANVLQQDTRQLQRAARRLKDGGEWKILKFRDHYDLLRELLQFPETAARMAEVKAVGKDIGWDPSQPLTAEIAQKLTLAGKHVTTDFTAAGRFARVYNSAVPFFNSGIQGPRANIRALRRDPIKFMMRGMQGTALALAMWWFNKDEEWWKDMDANERYLWTFIPIPGTDEMLRLPRAFEVDGLFMASAEALADAAYAQDPEVFTGWMGEFAQNLTQLQMADGIPVPPIPQTIRIGAEQLANRNFFFDSPIVPQSQQRDFAEEQFTGYTSNVAIGVGKIFKVSPRRFEHFVGSMFGPVGRDLLSVSGRGGSPPFPFSGEDQELNDIPVFGTLFQRGGQLARSSKSIDALYDAAEFAQKTRSKLGDSESEEQRQRRLMLNDATKALAALSLVEREAITSGERQEVRALKVTLARAAVRMNKGPVEELDRDFVLRISQSARAEAELIKHSELLNK